MSSHRHSWFHHRYHHLLCYNHRMQAMVISEANPHQRLYQTYVFFLNNQGLERKQRVREYTKQNENNPRMDGFFLIYFVLTRWVPVANHAAQSRWVVGEYLHRSFAPHYH